MATTKSLELSQLAKGITVDGNGDISAIALDTDVVSEGSSNLYYTQARVDARVAAATGANLDLSQSDTDDLTEGSTNLYYTNARADARIALQTGSNLDLSNKNTDNLSEGVSNLYFTNARSRAAISVSGSLSYNSTTGVISFTETAETVTSIALNGNSLDYTDENGTTTNIDLSGYLDEDARAISSGTLNGSTGIVTFTRDDATTFTLDLSALLDDTNLVTSVNGSQGVVVLDSDDISEGSTNLYYTDARAQAVSINNVVEDLTPQLGGTLDANGQDIDMGVNTITDSKVGQWDTAYSWGDHGAAGYLTSFTETDPVFLASPAGGITNTNTTNWNTAYNWGDHSTAGYGTIDDATALAIALG